MDIPVKYTNIVLEGEYSTPFLIAGALICSRAQIGFTLLKEGVLFNLSKDA